MLPVPGSGSIEIITNNDERYYANINNPAADEYGKYIRACNEKGFTVESETVSHRYEAFNSDGCKLEIMNYSTSIVVSLHAPIIMENLRWPSNDVGKVVPKPSSSTGKNQWENDDGFFLYVGNTSLDKFNAYIEQCINAGFDIDYSRGDKYFRAYNKDHYYISLNYEGFSIFSVNAEYKGEDDTPNEDSSEAPSSVQTVTPTEAPTEIPTTAATAKPTEKETIPVVVPDGFTVLQSFFCSCEFDSTVEEIENLAKKCDLYFYTYDTSPEGWKRIEMKVSAEPYSEETGDNEKYLFSGDYIHFVFDSYSGDLELDRINYHFNTKKTSTLRIEYVPVRWEDGSEFVAYRSYDIKDGDTKIESNHDAEPAMKSAKTKAE